MFFVYPTLHDEKKVHLAWTLETTDLDFFYSQRKFINLYKNLLRSIIVSPVNKNNHYIVILFLCYVFPFASEAFVFPLLR